MRKKKLIELKILIPRFWKKVCVEKSGCMLWTGSKSFGYGVFWDGSRTNRAHRWIYEKLRGLVPNGFELDHLCRNRACVNPDHLEVVTRTINLDRSPLLVTRSSLYCKKGHELTYDNTYYQKNNKTNTGVWRRCRICRLASNRKAKAIPPRRKEV